MKRIALPLNIRAAACLCLLLAGATCAAYLPVCGYDFVRYDDPRYVTENPQVLRGVTRSGLVWAMTTMHGGNWHPLTWLSHMLDCSLFGLDAGSHHRTNLLLHIANALLLFLVLRKMTGALWKCFLVAGLFALHPLHVESVAWISERKDLLSTFFWLLTMMLYVGYTRRPGAIRYTLVAACFLLGLMAKPMLVTLPVVLLLLDYWPLGRMPAAAAKRQQLWSALRLLYEKAPLFVMALASCVITVVAQQAVGAVQSFESFPLKVRLANACAAYLRYLIKAAWPTKLAVFYPFDGMPPPITLAAALLLIAVLTALAVRGRKKHPHFFVGWAWYLVTLLPVIGIVQVGWQSMADRYTYIPLCGIFILAAWSAEALLPQRRRLRPVCFLIGSVLLAACGLTTRAQLAHWSDSTSLFENALSVTRNNYVMHYNLGIQFINAGDYAQGLKHYLKAVEIKPDFSAAHNNIGLELARAGKDRAAIISWYRALRCKRNYPEPHFNLGLAYGRLGNTDLAIRHLYIALSLNPDYAGAYKELAPLLLRAGLPGPAQSCYQKAFSIRPEDCSDPALAKNISREAEQVHRRLQDAQHKLARKPESAFLHYRVGTLLKKAGQTAKAIEHFSNAFSKAPQYAAMVHDLAYLDICRSGNHSTLELLHTIAANSPRNYWVCYDIACRYAAGADPDQAIFWLTEAGKRGFTHWDLAMTDPLLDNMRESAAGLVFFKQIDPGNNHSAASAAPDK